MKQFTKSMLWLTPLAMTLAAGCAPAYRDYSGCDVDCSYCAPPPLPYSHYEGCVCHSCVASKYLTTQTLPDDTTTDDGVRNE